MTRHGGEEETMTDETADEMLERLRAMAAPDQQTWDLSPRDQEAIAWAVDVVDAASERRDLVRRLAESGTHAKVVLAGDTVDALTEYERRSLSGLVVSGALNPDPTE